MSQDTKTPSGPTAESTTRRVEASGYVGAYMDFGSETLEPVGDLGAVKLQPWGEEVSVVVDVKTFAGDRVETTATLSLTDAAKLRDDLDDVLAEAEVAGGSYARGRGDMESTPGGPE